jgi:hypothetical protein
MSLQHVERYILAQFDTLIGYGELGVRATEFIVTMMLGLIAALLIYVVVYTYKRHLWFSVPIALIMLYLVGTLIR